MGISVLPWIGMAQPTYTDKIWTPRADATKTFSGALLYESDDTSKHRISIRISTMRTSHTSARRPRIAVLTSHTTTGRSFHFPKSGKTDWNRVRHDVNNWATPPLLVYENDSASMPPRWTVLCLD